VVRDRIGGLPGYGVGRTVRTWPHRTGPRPFPWYWSVLFDVHVAFASAGKALSLPSSHTDSLAGNDWGRVMASTRQQPIRCSTVARTGFT
jgi:hypothetical protein